MNELKKLEGDMNPKLAKKISRYLIEDMFTYEQYHEYSIEFKRIHDAFLSFLNTTLSIESILSVVMVLGVTIDTIKIESILKWYKRVKNIDQLFEFFTVSYRSTKYGEYTYLLLKLLVNYYLYTNGYSLLIFYPSFTKGLNDLIESKSDNEVIKNLLISFYKESYIRNTTYALKSTSAVIEELLLVEDTLRLQYGINKLSLYGSYSKGVQTEFSDVDLYIETKESLTRYELEAINDFLSTIIEIRVNVSDESNFVHYEMMEVF